jgi:hypothetical protein
VKHAAQRSFQPLSVCPLRRAFEARSTLERRETSAGALVDILQVESRLPEEANKVEDRRFQRVLDVR